MSLLTNRYVVKGIEAASALAAVATARFVGKTAKKAAISAAVNGCKKTVEVGERARALEGKTREF